AMLPEAMMPEPAVLVMLCEVAVVAAAKVFRLGETGHVRASNRYTHSAWNESYIVEVGPLPTGGIGVQADGAVAAFRIIGDCHFEPLIGPCHGNSDALGFVPTVELQVGVVVAGAAANPGA